MEKIKNLWPDDLANVKITMPKEILLQQGNYISELTKNLIVADVKTDQGVLQGTDEKVMVHRFILKAPTMGNYSFNLLRVMHNFGIYPVTVWNGLTEEKTIAENEEEFMQIIGAIFSSNETRNAISSIIAQSI